MDTLIGVKQATAHLGVSEKTIYRLVAQGQLPVVKIANRTLFRRRDLEALVSRSTLLRGADRT